jgi:hypothetical protein
MDRYHTGSFFLTTVMMNMAEHDGGEDVEVLFPLDNEEPLLYKIT